MSSDRTPRRIRIGLVGISEARLTSELEEIPELEGLRVIRESRDGVIDLHVRLSGDPPVAEDPSDAAEMLDRAVRAVRRRLAEAVFEVGDRDLVEVVLDRLRAAGGSLAVAESCTGGLLGQEITSIPGSSGQFWGGVIAYHDAAKVALLGVSPDTLARHGSVSREAAREMAAGIRSRSGAEWAIAITGIAGPGGGTEEKPVGTVWIALEGAGTTVARHLFPGDRRAVRRRSVHGALDALRRGLESG